mmetsp:Transcript_52646/g.157711  ORF Transcript_52646/g.157711 Transcript_52646/m.157711 type:complete len:153 (-) Transcript_52646:200-658(-)
MAVYAERRKFMAREGVERNYIEGLAQDDVDEEGGAKEEYNLEGRRDVELASGSITEGKKGEKEPLSASMHLDPDGSSTMPLNGKTGPVAGKAFGKRGKKEPLAASMPLDPDGSSTMPQNGKKAPAASNTSGKDTFDEEDKPSGGNGTGGELA